MDLAKFAQMPPENNGAFLKFTPKENIKIVRFCYEKPEDIQCRQKLYDPATTKVIWDTPEGKWTMSLKVAVYTSKSAFEMMTWDRSARFGADTLLPLFEAAGGDIIDTVYKITCSKAGTLDATYSFFPLKDSDAYAMPELTPAEGEAEEEDEEVEEEEAAEEEEAPAAVSGKKPAAAKPAPAPAKTPAAAAPKKKKNFWEE